MITNSAALRRCVLNIPASVLVAILVTCTPIVVKAQDQFRNVASSTGSAWISAINKAFENHNVQQPLVALVEDGRSLERFCPGTGSECLDLAVRSHQRRPLEIQSGWHNRLVYLTKRKIEFQSDNIGGGDGYMDMKANQRRVAAGADETVAAPGSAVAPAPRTCPPNCADKTGPAPGSAVALALRTCPPNCADKTGPAPGSAVAPAPRTCPPDCAETGPLLAAP